MRHSTWLPRLIWCSWPSPTTCCPGWLPGWPRLVPFTPVSYTHLDVYKRQVLARIEGEPFDLIEALAEVIAADVLSLPGVEAVDVVVHKPQAPVGVPVTDVRVEIRRERGTRVVIALGSNCLLYTSRCV